MKSFGVFVFFLSLFLSWSLKSEGQIMNPCSVFIQDLVAKTEQAFHQTDYFEFENGLNQLDRVDHQSFDSGRFYFFADLLAASTVMVPTTEMIRQLHHMALREEMHLITELRTNPSSKDRQEALSALGEYNQSAHLFLSSIAAEALYNAVRFSEEEFNGEKIFEGLVRQYEKFRLAFPIMGDAEEDALNPRFLDKNKNPVSRDILYRDLHSMNYATTVRARYFLSLFDQSLLYWSDQEISQVDALMEAFVKQLDVLQESGQWNSGLEDYEREMEKKRSRVYSMFVQLQQAPSEADQAQLEKRIQDELETMLPMEFELPIHSEDEFNGLNLYQIFAISGETRIQQTLVQVLHAHPDFFWRADQNLLFR